MSREIEEIKEEFLRNWTYNAPELFEEVYLKLEEADKHISSLEEKVKELENNINDPEWCCAEHKIKLVARIKELEEAIDDFLHGIKGEDHGLPNFVLEKLSKALKEK